VGLAILTKWTRVGAYVASAWLVLIAINLVSTGMFFDIAVRDVEIAWRLLCLRASLRFAETRYRVTSFATGVQEGLSPLDANGAGHIWRCL
jgi:hypothetical protein